MVTSSVMSVPTQPVSGFNEPWQGFETLIRAIQRADLSFVKQQLSMKETFVVGNSHDNRFTARLLGLALEHLPAIVLDLLDMGIKPTSEDLNSAIEKERPDFVSHFLNEGAKLNETTYTLLSQQNGETFNLMIRGIYHFLDRVIEKVPHLLPQFLQKGLVPTTTHLNAVVKKDLHDLIQPLLHAGARPDRGTYMDVIKRGTTGTLQTIIAAELYNDPYLLEYAIMERKPEMFWILQRAGIAINERTLKVAIRYSSELTTQLIELVQPDATNFNCIMLKYSPERALTLARRLVTKGIRPNSQALTIAVNKGSQPLIKFLLAEGIEPTSNAISLANRKRSRDISNLLEESQRTPNAKRPRLLSFDWFKRKIENTFFLDDNPSYVDDTDVHDTLPGGH